MSEHFTSEEREHIEKVVRPAFEQMETHCEIFALPSGRELWLFCDGRYRIETPNRQAEKAG